MGTARYVWSGRCRIVLLLASLAIISTGARSQDQSAQPPSSQTENPPPENPQPESQRPNSQEQPSQEQPPKEEPPKEEKKDESPNPAQAAAEKTKEVTVQAAVATKNLGQAALIKARDWESGWLTGTYVGAGRTIVPMTPKQRREIYLEQTLTSPGAYLKRMFAAGIDQARGSPYQWGGGLQGYGERFASREGQFITSNTLAYLGNSALKYEPRYDQCRCSGFWPRTRHAIMRNFLTYNGSERQLRPQWALYGGAFGGGLVSTAWKPKPRNAFAEGNRAAAEQGGYGSALNIFIEFLPDINRAIGATTRRKK